MWIARSFALLLAVASAVVAHRELREDRVGSAIMGGQDAPRGRFRYMASLRYINSNLGEDSHVCGGSLIHPRIVMTAAHCVINTLTLEPYIDARFRPAVRIGGHNLNWEPAARYERRRTVRTFVHPKFAGGDPLPSDYLNNDVALLLLDRPSTMPTVRVSAGRRKPDNPHPDYTPLIALGWGMLVTSPDEAWPEKLQMLDLTLLPLSTCQANVGEQYWRGSWQVEEHVQYNFSSNAMLCAAQGYPNARADACAGDSGGPLVVPRSSCSREDVAMGLVSWGDTCTEGASGITPGVYTNLAMVRPWIAAMVQKFTNDTLPMPTSATCRGRVFSNPLVRGFGGCVSTYNAKPGGVNILTGLGLRLTGTMRSMPSMGGTALGSVRFSFGSVVRAQAAGQAMRVWVNEEAFSANSTAAVANNGSVTFEASQAGITRRLIVQQPGATVTIEQRFLRSNGSYAAWLDLSITLHFAPLTALSGVLGETFKPSVTLGRAAAAGRASKLTASFSFPA